MKTNKKWALKKVEKETEPHCWHCGTSIIYVCWIVSNDGDVKAVGRQCCSNFLLKSDVKKAKDACDQLTRGEKIRHRIDEAIVCCEEIHGSESKTKESLIRIAEWMVVIGATWHWVKSNYPEYYAAKYPAEA